MNTAHAFHRDDLVRIAIEAMKERGLEPEFADRVARHMDAIDGPGQDDAPRVRDLTALPWCLIDNDDSRDLGARLHAPGRRPTGG